MRYPPRPMTTVTPETPLTGLTTEEAAQRRAAGLGNDVAIASSRSYRQILRDNVFTFINNVLFGLGLTLVLLGRVTDALVSVGVILVNVIVSVVQEVRAKRTLDRIALLTRPKATVVRDGVEREVDPAEIVLGDLLAVGPGDQIVVDGVFASDGRIDVDESLLTGESDLVPKSAGDAVLSGSFVVNGAGRYLATKVGAESFANSLTAGAKAFRRVLTPLQRKIHLVVRVLLLIVVYFEILLVVNAVLAEIPVLQSVQASVVIFGLVPNGLFLAIAVAYAAGAVRIAGRGALVQQANAIESLSNVDVLCLDKTGTLTANRILFDRIEAVGIDEDEVRRLLGIVVASASSGNRTSEAIAAACPGEAKPVSEEVAFSSERKWSGLVIDGTAYVLGAPEMLRPALAADPTAATVADWSARGLRVLLFARQRSGSLHDSRGQPVLPAGLEPIGVLGFSDELRPEAKETLRQFAESGVRVKIISGDNPETVAALARQAGLEHDVRLVSGLELAGMSPAQLETVAVEGTIFGRITPQQKEGLVDALKRRGFYVAMIGDGVNDVLSLKKADLGIAMESGSQATRAVADIVLLGSSFAALAPAVREGQRILNGMQDVLRLFLTRVAYFALLIISTAIVGGFPFTPKTASISTLFTVGLPTLALAAWAQPGPVVKGQHIRPLLYFIIPAALTLSLAGLLVYIMFLLMGFATVQTAQPELSPDQTADLAVPYAQAAIVTFTVLCGLVLLVFLKPPVPWLAVAARYTGDRRPALLAVLLLAAYAVVLTVPGFGWLLEMPQLTLWEHALLALIVATWATILYTIWRRRLLDRFLAVDLADLAGFEPSDAR
ncbi:MAG: cation transporter E1-E2 family ATPase [Dehalococcoidia bacterium]|nr:MAG: cation transporter E1-E2 family ATPase [Dehalococcoidia bacterium]